MNVLRFGINLLLMGLTITCSSKKTELQTTERMDMAAKPPYPTPTINTIGGDQAQLVVTFRSAKGVEISGTQPAILNLSKSEHKCKIVSGPSRSIEPVERVVDRAIYALPKKLYLKLQKLNPDSVTVALRDNDRYWAYPYLSADLIERR